MTRTHVTDPQATPPENRPPTVEEYLEAYSQQPIEIINGEVVAMHPPEFIHIELAHRIYDSLKLHVLERAPGGVYIEAPYLLEADDRSDWVRGARVPDVSYVAQARLEAHLAQHGRQGPLRLAPDLAIEIVSKNDLYLDIEEKVADYLRYGVRLVVVVNPRLRSIRVYTPENPGGNTLTEGDTLSTDPVIPGWSMRLSDLFAE